MFLNNKTNFWSNYNNYSNFFPKTTIVIYPKLFLNDYYRFHRFYRCFSILDGIGGVLGKNM